MPPSIALRVLVALAPLSIPLPMRAAQRAQEVVANDAFVAWAASSAIPLPPLDGPASSWATSHVTRLSAFTSATRVVGLGESVHGTRELTSLRTRLTEQLVAEGRVAAIVLESGMAEGRDVGAWVDGSSAEMPDLTRKLSYGWGREPGTLEALRRLREHNTRVPAARRVHFYGMDLPANGGGSLLPALEPVWGFLDAADPRYAAESRRVLRPLAAAVASESYGIVGKYAALSSGARDSLRGAVHDLAARLHARERAYVARTSRDRYAWALRLAELAGQTEGAVRIGWNDASNPRDRAMAENVRWVLTRERARGLVVIWAHDLHVARAPIGGPMFAGRGGAPFVASMGEYLARSLGPGYLAVGTAFRRSAADSAGVVAEPASVDGALARIGRPLYLIDLARAPRAGPVRRWLGAAHPKRAENGYVVTTPGRAYDAMIYVDSIGPATRD